MKRPGILILILLALSLATGPRSARAETGHGVILRDLKPKDEAHLKRVLPHLLDGQADLATLDEAIRVLMKGGGYENVFVEKTAAGNFEIIGKPLRTVEEVRFTGVHEVSEADLRALLDFQAGERFDRKKAVAAGEKMKDYYGEHGFFNTIIELNFEKTESKNIRLIFAIQEKTPCLIRRMAFITPNTDLKNLLDSKFRWIIDQPLTTERLHSFMQELSALLIERRYLATEMVGPEAHYNPEKTEAYMQIEIREPYRYEFYFDGNQYFSTVDVYKALDLHNHERKNVDPPSEAAERLRRAYLAKGFSNVQIKTDVTNPVAFLRRTHYQINEGHRVKIDSVQVQGRISRAPSYYEKFILGNSSDLVSSGYYNRQDLENGFKNLETQLRNEGYLRAKVLSSRVESNDRRDKATIYVMLEEGPQTQIRAIDFTGNKFFSSFELSDVTGLETNTALRLDKFEESLQKLKDFYHDQGFLEMKLLNEGDQLIEYNEKGTQARINFQIYEGPRIRVHTITVEGNSMTKARVILKESGFTLGEVLTPQKMDDATSRLNRMGLFSRVDIHTLEEGTNIPDRTLIISVTEVTPGLYSFGGGVTNERNLTLRGFTGASYNNLWGTARAISGKAEVRDNVRGINYLESTLSAGYLEPFVFNTRTRGRLNLTRSQYVYDYRPEIGGYTEITIKNRAAFSLEHDLTQHTRLTYNLWTLESRLDFEVHNIKIPDNPDTVPDATVHESRKDPLQVATTGPQIDIDYRDNPFMPTKGTNTRVSALYSHPSIGSSRGVNFVKMDGSFTDHHRVGHSGVIWANSVGAGYLSNLSRDEGSGVPSDYAFILGGIYTVRGFSIASPNERIPKDGNDGFSLGSTNEKLIKQDSEYYLVKSELRFPVTTNAGIVVFYDGGAVFITGYHFYRPYRDAVGFGLRYNTPVGPVAMDLAFKINPEHKTATQDAESPVRFTFTIGTF